MEERHREGRVLGRVEAGGVEDAERVLRLERPERRRALEQVVRPLSVPLHAVALEVHVAERRGGRARVVQADEAGRVGGGDSGVQRRGLGGLLCGPPVVAVVQLARVRQQGAGVCDAGVGAGSLQCCRRGGGGGLVALRDRADSKKQQGKAAHEQATRSSAQRSRAGA